MIQIKPIIQQQCTCPYCERPLAADKILWAGMRVCLECQCPSCGARLIEDLKVGHAVNYPYCVDLAKGQVFGSTVAKGWLGDSLLKSLNPRHNEIDISKEVFEQCRRVIILNCIDSLYGHCLLKLLNAQRHLDRHVDCGLILIVPRFLRWMVPQGVAEIWTVNIPLRNGLDYYPAFDRFVHEECKRFEEIHVSQAFSHPGEFDIARFTGVPKYSFDKENPKITFVWREDRHWCSFLPFRALRKMGIVEPMLLAQNLKITSLFKRIQSILPDAQFAVAGLGTRTRFPRWIEDSRVNEFDEQAERKVCKIYAESFLVIGTHGSNMLLASGHAGMTIDLMPNGRWDNFAQDILYHEADPRIAAFRYRYLPYTIGIAELAHIASSMFLVKPYFYSNMTADKLP